MSLASKLAVIFATALLLAPAPDVHADKGGKNGHGHGHHKARVKHRVKAAGPPPWAPAHGYRRGQPRDQAQEGYEQVGERIGIPAGTCDREALGAVLGGVVGGVLGSRVGGGDGRTVATIAGTVIGVLVGSHIGRGMDEADRQCTGQALERAPDQRTVAWTNPDTGARYAVTPVSTYRADGRDCRDYLTRVEVRGEPVALRGSACRDADGTWRTAPG